MIQLQATTEQHELLNDDQQSTDVTDFEQPLSVSRTNGLCEKKQLLMNEIEDLKAQWEKYMSEVDEMYIDIAPLEALLEDEDALDADRLYEIRKQLNSLKIPYDSRKTQASSLASRIDRRENLLNHETLMAGFIEAMENWKADEQELNEKRDSLSTRLEQIQQQATEDMTKARQAETDAATAYAQAVAWGDTEGERTANADAQKAAKNLTTATEHNRRQRLIIAALEQELVIVDQHIVEAQKEYKGIERSALLLAHTVLEEQWNEKAEELLDMGGKLWASYRMIDRDQISLRKLLLPVEGERFNNWNSGDLSERSYKYTVRDV
ncbi:hypothetical protein PS663_05450 [Pseudomonas fluorescens]|nr:hypothetical protein PS663_05450 [Pseudomonas fluorescens]